MTSANNKFIEALEIKRAAEQRAKDYKQFCEDIKPDVVQECIDTGKLSFSACVYVDFDLSKWAMEEKGRCQDQVADCTDDDLLLGYEQELAAYTWASHGLSNTTLAYLKNIYLEPHCWLRCGEDLIDNSFVGQMLQEAVGEICDILGVSHIDLDKLHDKIRQLGEDCNMY